jgi:hypothetical protein
MKHIKTALLISLLAGLSQAQADITLYPNKAKEAVMPAANSAAVAQPGTVSRSAAQSLSQTQQQKQAAAMTQAPPAELTMRCWQGGKLLFETKDVRRISSSSVINAPTSKTKLTREEIVDRIGDAQPIRVFDFENGLCIVS